MRKTVDLFDHAQGSITHLCKSAKDGAPGDQCAL
jgi:hypothetical protein